MSPVLKSLLGIIVLLCFVQFITMAHIPRHERAADDLAHKLEDLGLNLNEIFRQQMDRFKHTFGTDEFKQQMASGAEQFNKFVEGFKKSNDKD